MIAESWKSWRTLDSGDKLLDIAVRAPRRRAIDRGIALLLLNQHAGAIEPEVLKVVTRGRSTGTKVMVRQPERPGLWRLVKDCL